MAKPKTQRARATPVIPVASGADPNPVGHPHVTGPEPGSAAGPASAPLAQVLAAQAAPLDRDGDGRPGGSDALHPYAVLLAPHGGISAGAVVHGPRPAIAALVDASAARMATLTDLDIAGVHVHALPCSTTPATPET